MPKNSFFLFIQLLLYFLDRNKNIQTGLAHYKFNSFFYFIVVGQSHISI